MANKIEILKSIFSEGEKIFNNEHEIAVNCVCYDIDAVVMAVYDKIDERITLSVKSEDATAFEDCMALNGFDLTEPEVNQELWSDVHEIWINFKFVWDEDQRNFIKVVNGLLH